MALSLLAATSAFMVQTPMVQPTQVRAHPTRLPAAPPGHPAPRAIAMRGHTFINRRAEGLDALCISTGRRPRKVPGRTKAAAAAAKGTGYACLTYMRDPGGGSSTHRSASRLMPAALRAPFFLVGS